MLLLYFTLEELFSLFLLPDGVGIDDIIKPQDVQTEKPHDQRVHCRHQPADGHTHTHTQDKAVVNMMTDQQEFAVEN